MSLFPSQDLQDLFKGMLEKNPDERFSVEEVINSRWMQGEIPTKEEIEEEAIYIVQSLAS